MRRPLSILLLAVLLLPLLTPFLALGQDSDAGLPACCRRNGKHHCMMSMAERSRLASRDPQFTGPIERCPYCPATPASVHPTTVFLPMTRQAIFAGFFSHPAGTPQTESKWRIARDRSRQKRGPPSTSLTL